MLAIAPPRPRTVGGRRSRAGRAAAGEGPGGGDRTAAAERGGRPPDSVGFPWAPRIIAGGRSGSPPAKRTGLRPPAQEATTKGRERSIRARRRKPGKRREVWVCGG